MAAVFFDEFSIACCFNYNNNSSILLNANEFKIKKALKLLTGKKDSYPKNLKYFLTIELPAKLVK
jgi:uncharacterized Fe-S radical SAM superfamily protein PflX